MEIGVVDDSARDLGWVSLGGFWVEFVKLVEFPYGNDAECDEEHDP